MLQRSGEAASPSIAPTDGIMLNYRLRFRPFAVLVACLLILATMGVLSSVFASHARTLPLVHLGTATDHLSADRLI